MRPQDLIRRKRDGHLLSESEIREFINGVCNGTWTNAQISALLMAMFIRGLSESERNALVNAMVYSGEVLDLSDLGVPKADKHSTGGVGDKTSLIIAPLASACGVAVPMISGRGLGHTGGTLDKLESIPGYNVNLDITQIKKIIADCGFALGSQTSTLVPADRKLYALRDETATIESLPLIVASIMSKKLAEGLDVLVLDVKVGNGAFMQSFDEAFKLAQAMVDTGKTFDVKTEALISDMNQPLGRFAGNSLEVYEILRIMRGEADEMMRDTVDLSISLVAKMLVLAGVCNNFNTALKTSIESLENGSALEKFKRNLELQGGNPAICDDPELILDKKMLKIPVNAEKSGFISEINTRSLGEAIVMMGGGRAKPDDEIDHAVGIEFLRKIGDEVRHGEEICIIHCRDISQAEIISQRVKAAYKIESEIESEKILKPHLIYGFVN